MDDDDVLNQYSARELLEAFHVVGLSMRFPRFMPSCGNSLAATDDDYDEGTPPLRTAAELQGSLDLFNFRSAFAPSSALPGTKSTPNSAKGSRLFERTSTFESKELERKQPVFSNSAPLRLASPHVADLSLPPALRRCTGNGGAAVAGATLSVGGLSGAPLGEEGAGRGGTPIGSPFGRERSVVSPVDPTELSMSQPNPPLFSSPKPSRKTAAGELAGGAVAAAGSMSRTRRELRRSNATSSRTSGGGWMSGPLIRGTRAQRSSRRNSGASATSWTPSLDLWAIGPRVVGIFPPLFDVAGGLSGGSKTPMEVWAALQISNVRAVFVGTSTLLNESVPPLSQWPEFDELPPLSAPSAIRVRLEVEETRSEEFGEMLEDLLQSSEFESSLDSVMPSEEDTVAAGHSPEDAACADRSLPLTRLEGHSLPISSFSLFSRPLSPKRADVAGGKPPSTDHDHTSDSVGPVQLQSDTSGTNGAESLNDFGSCSAAGDEVLGSRRCGAAVAFSAQVPAPSQFVLKLFPARLFFLSEAEKMVASVSQRKEPCLPLRRRFQITFSEKRRILVPTSNGVPRDSADGTPSAPRALTRPLRFLAHDKTIREIQVARLQRAMLRMLAAREARRRRLVLAGRAQYAAL